MDNIDNFIPKFRSKKEIEEINYDLCMKQLSLNIDEQSLDQMFYDNKISESDYLKMKNKLNEHKDLFNKPNWNKIKKYFDNH